MGEREEQKQSSSGQKKMEKKSRSDSDAAQESGKGKLHEAKDNSDIKKLSRAQNHERKEEKKDERMVTDSVVHQDEGRSHAQKLLSFPTPPPTIPLAAGDVAGART